jgi:predicted DNA-binding protein (MmcQ/YjbR family)
VDRDTLAQYCMSQKGTTQDIKWEDDLCFCVGGKMYAVQSLEEPFGMSFKVQPDEFDELTSRPGIIPAPYLARYQWVLVEDVAALTRRAWMYYLKQSYELIFSKLSRKVQQQIQNA